MNAWVFRHLDELQRIYGAESGSEPQQGASAGCIQVVEPAVKASPRRSATESPSPKAQISAGETVPGSVIRCETPDGPDVILAPARRQRRPRR